MKRILPTLLLSLSLSTLSFAQIMPLTSEPDGGNKKAGVAEQIGIVKIAISYGKPGVIVYTSCFLSQLIRKSIAQPPV